MDENCVYFKCEFDEFIEMDQQSDDKSYFDFLKRLQKHWPKGEPIVFNSGTENECKVEYIAYSRIDGCPIFKLIKGERENVYYGVFGYIDDKLYSCKSVKFIEPII